jgi:hypothetical protein
MTRLNPARQLEHELGLVELQFAQPFEQLVHKLFREKKVTLQAA